MSAKHSQQLDITIRVSRAGACLIDVVIFASDNPAALDDAGKLLDIALNKPNQTDWLIAVFPWSTNYELGISRRSFSTLTNQGQSVIADWLKQATAKFGRALTIENTVK